MKMTTVLLREIAHARSGSEDSHANIGIIAYTPAGFTFLRQSLSSNKIETYFKTLGVVKTVRYELPNLNAFNFVLYGIFPGGDGCSLRVDAQGKVLAQAILELPIEIPFEILPQCRQKGR